MESNSKENFLVMDDNGFIIEKSKNFNTSISGYAFDILQKSRKILNSDSTINNVEIIYEKKTILLKDDTSSKLNVCMLMNEDKE